MQPPSPNNPASPALLSPYLTWLLQSLSSLLSPPLWLTPCPLRRRAGCWRPVKHAICRRLAITFARTLGSTVAGAVVARADRWTAELVKWEWEMRDCSRHSVEREFGKVTIKQCGRGSSWNSMRNEADYIHGSHHSSISISPYFDVAYFIASIWSW